MMPAGSVRLRHVHIWKAQVRLCARYRRLSARGKTANVANVAIAHEMVGFTWSIACTIQSAPKTA
jgi:transposase